METIKTIKEMVEVMEAFEDGKKIQLRNRFINIWVDTEYPIWDWSTCEYRIKPEPTYRPYKSVDEMVEDFDKRFPYQHERRKYTMPLIWVKNKFTKTVALYNSFCDDVDCLKSEFEWNEYLDGTPFGKLVEE